MELQLVQIQSKIYHIRGQKVMLDRDLAEMYGVETKVLNQSVKRNIERFEGDDFMFQLSDIEVQEFSRSQFATLNLNQNLISQNEISNSDERSRSQIVTLNKGRGSNIKYAPFAFTELGVAMLSSVLHSKSAIEVNRSIMRAFVYIRQMLFAQPVGEFQQLQCDVKLLQEWIRDVFSNQHSVNEDTRVQLELINQALEELQTQKQLPEKPRKRMGYIHYDDEEKKIVNE